MSAGGIVWLISSPVSRNSCGSFFWDGREAPHLNVGLMSAGVYVQAPVTMSQCCVSV